MCNMHLFAICSIVFAAAIGLSDAIFWPTPSPVCTVLLDVPITPADSYFHAILFPTLDDKLRENQGRFNRDLRQVWVDAPHPRFCGFQANGRCCLNGKFALVNPQYPQQYRAQYFQNGDLKKAANEQLWSQGQFNPRGYQVWADAPDRYCQRAIPYNSFNRPNYFA